MEWKCFQNHSPCLDFKLLPTALFHTSYGGLQKWPSSSSSSVHTLCHVTWKLLPLVSECVMWDVSGHNTKKDLTKPLSVFASSESFHNEIPSLLHIPMKIPLKVGSSWSVHRVWHGSESFLSNCLLPCLPPALGFKAKGVPEKCCRVMGRCWQFIYCKTNLSHKTEVAPLVFVPICVISLGKQICLI